MDAGKLISESTVIGVPPKNVSNFE